MILYNTIVGLAAGAGLLLVAQLLKQFGEKVQPEGFALGAGVTGSIQTVLGLTISVTWPYTKVLHANIMLGEPALAFGVLLGRTNLLGVAVELDLDRRAVGTHCYGEMEP